MPNSSLPTKAGLRMTEMRIQVTRCTCGHPETHKPHPCPQGVADPAATRVLRKYRNPIRQFIWDHLGR